jgi:hypothetical protein
LFTGLEDNANDGNGEGMPWQRAVNGRSIKYWRIAKNGSGLSNDEPNKKTRNSRYVRYIYRLTSPEPCVFSFEDINEFSKGDSQEDFSVYSSGNLLNGLTFNFANAHTFKFQDDGLGTPILILVGPRVICAGTNYCEDAWNSQFSGLSPGRFSADEHIDRGQKALAIVKKACPGKEF